MGHVRWVFPLDELVRVVYVPFTRIDILSLYWLEHGAYHHRLEDQIDL